MQSRGRTRRQRCPRLHKLPHRNKQPVNRHRSLRKVQPRSHQDPRKRGQVKRKRQPRRPSQQMHKALIQTRAARPRARIRQRLFIPRRHTSHRVHQPTTRQRGHLNNTTRSDRRTRPQQRPVLVQPTTQLLRRPRPNVRNNNNQPTSARRSNRRQDPARARKRKANQRPTRRRQTHSRINKRTRQPTMSRNIRHKASTKRTQEILQQPIYKRTPVITSTCQRRTKQSAKYRIKQSQPITKRVVESPKRQQSVNKRMCHRLRTKGPQRET